MSKIIVDVTQLMQWSGRLTGVPRVTHELVMRFAEENNAIFVTWHGYDFCEVEKEEVFKSREVKADNLAIINTEKKGESFIGRLKSTLSRFTFAKKTYGVLKGYYNMYRPDRESTPAEIFTPKKDDVFFIAEGIWSDERYIEKVAEFKDEGAKIVQISYDMLPIVTPQYSGHSTEWLKNYASKIYPICDLVLSISQYTKKDITEWLEKQGLGVPRIEVFRLGENFKQSGAKKPDQPKKLTKATFILCVGTIEARKNHTLLYYAYKRAASQDIDMPQLVIVGRRGWHAENIYDLMSTDPQVCDKVTILENCSDEELTWLYKNCLFTIYPSFYEGWGLPIAESMYYGIPCLSSNTSSMPEVAGNLATYFDPTSPDDALEKIQYLLDSRNLEKAQEKAKRYEPTSWDETYKSVKKYIMEIV